LRTCRGSRASFIGVATPAVGLWVLEGLYVQREPERDDRPGRRGVPSTAWVLTATASLAILWTAFGFFGVKPSFIPSHSMEPAIDRRQHRRDEGRQRGRARAGGATW